MLILRPLLPCQHNRCPPGTYTAAAAFAPGGASFLALQNNLDPGASEQTPPNLSVIRLRHLERCTHQDHWAREPAVAARFSSLWGVANLFLVLPGEPSVVRTFVKVVRGFSGVLKI